MYTAYIHVYFETNIVLIIICLITLLLIILCCHCEAVSQEVTYEQWCYLASRTCTRAAVEFKDGGCSGICLWLAVPRGVCDLLPGKFSCLYGAHRLIIAFLTTAQQVRNISVE